MEQLDLDLYHVEELDERDGVRIMTGDDEVYEAWAEDDVQYRVYPGRRDWTVKIRFPADSATTAYEHITALDDRITEAYGASLDVSPKRFGDDMEESTSTTYRAGGCTVRYTAEADLNRIIDRPMATSSKLKGVAASYAKWTGGSGLAGGAIGGLLGLLAGGPPAAVGGATMGAGILGGVSGVGTTISLMETMDSRISGWDTGFSSHAKMAQRFEDRRRRRYLDEEMLMGQGHLDHLNELHALERELERAEMYDPDRRELYEELRDGPWEGLHDSLMDVHFTNVERLEGVTVTTSAETYGDAIQQGPMLAGQEPFTAVEPSIYTDLDAFTRLFSFCGFEKNGEERLFEDAHRLVGTYLERDDTDPAIGEWLDDHYPELVQELGRERSLNRDGGTD